MNEAQTKHVLIETEQEKIVAVLNDLNRRTKKLKTNYKKELYNLVELKKILLEKAFKGELV